MNLNGTKIGFDVPIPTVAKDGTLSAATARVSFPHSIGFPHPVLRDTVTWGPGNLAGRSINSLANTHVVKTQNRR